MDNADDTINAIRVEVHEGGCLCGNVRFKVRANPSTVVVCHCVWCQRRTGSAFAVIPKFDKSEFELIAGTLTHYRSVNEFGRWLELGFCATCGTNIGFTQERRPELRAVDAGTFDDPSWISPDRQGFRHIFVRSSRDWSNVPEGSECFQDHLPT